jgi:amphi-Trp domain-containing protein
VEPKLELEIDERLPASAVALILEMMAIGLRKGRGRVASGDVSLEFALPSELGFELEVSIDPKKGRGKVELEFFWHLEGKPTERLRISSPSTTTER